jgi:hypothetical protein
MYPSNTLNRRPRGMSVLNHSAARDEPSILPKFLRRLSSRTPSGDSYDRAEKMVHGSNGGYANGTGHRNTPSLAALGGGARGRIYKIVGVILFCLTALYFFLPWSPSFSSFGLLLRVHPLISRDTKVIICVHYCLLEAIRFNKTTCAVCSDD